MLKDKMLWMKDSGNIRDEIRQCREEGLSLIHIFRLNELLSRIHSLLRRAGKKDKKEEEKDRGRLESGNIHVDLHANRAYLGEQPLELTAQEYSCLLYTSRCV